MLQVVLPVMLLCQAASAQLAVVATYTEDDAVQRHLVGTVVEAATARWQALTPQLLPDEVRACPANDATCLRALARRRGATHLILIGVAPLEPRDTVVAIQLFAVDAEQALLDATTLQPGDAGGSDDGSDKVRALAERLLAVSGPALAVRPSAPSLEPDPPGEGGLGALGIGGLTTISVGLVCAGATALFATYQFTEQQDFAGMTSSVLIGGSLSGTLLLSGVALLSAATL